MLTRKNSSTFFQATCKIKSIPKKYKYFFKYNFLQDVIKCDDLESESMENEKCQFDVKNNLKVKKNLLEENLSVEEVEAKESTKREG